MVCTKWNTGWSSLFNYMVSTDSWQLTAELCWWWLVGDVCIHAGTWLGCFVTSYSYPSLSYFFIRVCYRVANWFEWMSDYFYTWVRRFEQHCQLRWTQTQNQHGEVHESDDRINDDKDIMHRFCVVEMSISLSSTLSTTIVLATSWRKWTPPWTFMCTFQLCQYTRDCCLLCPSTKKNEQLFVISSSYQWSVNVSV